jgi:GT2 family glycosyltransferase
VNSSPEQRTAAVAAEFPEMILVESHTRLLPHAARNAGAEIAKGALLVFSDPDCIADRDWLAHLVEAWRSGHAVVGGAMDVSSRRWFEVGVHVCKFHPLLAGQPEGPRWILPTANVAYARREWEQIGPFEGESFAGDAILSWKARAAGFKPWFEPRAVVAHRHGGSTAAFVRERMVRGAEFGAIRGAYEQWSRARLTASLLATPLLIFWILMCAARDASRSGWLRRFLWTLPLQIAGHGAWCLGEAVGYWRDVKDLSLPRKVRSVSAQGSTGSSS